LYKNLKNFILCLSFDQIFILTSTRRTTYYNRIFLYKKANISIKYCISIQISLTLIIGIASFILARNIEFLGLNFYLETSIKFRAKIYIFLSDYYLGRQIRL
jgi:hypothetical protein